MRLLPEEPTPEMCLAGSKERLAGHVYRAMVAAYEGDRFEDGNLLENVEKMRKTIEALKKALQEIAEKDPRTSYITYRHMAKQSLKEIENV
jgi:hypothetical protein